MKPGLLPTVHRTLALIGWLAAPVLQGADPEAFYTQRGDDPTFQEILAGRDLPQGRNSTNGVKGSRIKVNDSLLKEGPNARRKIPQNIRIHTLGNSFIRRGDFEKWSRWYQEDGNTQIFRLFKDEENVRNSRKKAARIEAFSILKWKRGTWHEWVGTYTIIKPHNCAIFQSKNNVNDWSVQLNMRANGDILLNHRRAPDKIIARNMTGKPFHVRVRDNGHEYEVYLNGEKKGAGVYARPEGETSFRWGMYLGGSDVRHEAMILVTGAGIDPRDYEPELARVESEEPAAPETPEPEGEIPPNGLPIPERDWTNADGRTIRAAGLYEVGSDYLNLRINDEWVEYPLEKLSDEDRAALLMAENFVSE